MRREDLSPARRALLEPCPEWPGASAINIPLAPRGPIFGASTTALRQANFALRNLVTLTASLPDAALVTHTLARREAVLSNQIEGTHSTVGDLLEYEATGDIEGLPADVKVTHNYAHALQEGLEVVVNRGAAIDAELICDLHRLLMTGTDYRYTPGEIRTVQNWIGGRGNIYTATFVPPRPERVQALLQDLSDYIAPDEDSLLQNTLQKAAVAHAQFEGIHPFCDGNGRVGRLLPPLMLARDGYPPLYIAGFLKTNQDAYYGLLRGIHLRDEWAPWIDFFCEAVTDSVRTSSLTAHALIAARDGWRERLAGYRRDSVVHRLPDVLLRTPTVTVNKLRDALGVSFPTANDAVQQLVKVGILRPTGTAQRNRSFVADDVIRVLNTPPELLPPAPAAGAPATSSPIRRQP